MFFYFKSCVNLLFQAAPLDVSCQNIKACGTDTFLYIVVDNTMSKDFCTRFFRYDPNEDEWTKLDSICSMYRTDDISLLDASNFL